MSRPLEDRFPTLYHHISEEREARTGKLIEKRVPKDTPPTLHDVVNRVLQANGVHSTGLASDLVSAIQEFTLEPVKEFILPKVPKAKRKPKVPKAPPVEVVT